MVMGNRHGCGQVITSHARAYRAFCPVRLNSKEVIRPRTKQTTHSKGRKTVAT
jgi:hypothetical protein